MAATLKSGFQRFTSFNNDLVAVECIKLKVILDKPMAIYIGFTVLETSKRIIMEMHYNTIKKKAICEPGAQPCALLTQARSFNTSSLRI